MEFQFNLSAGRAAASEDFRLDSVVRYGVENGSEKEKDQS